MSGSEVYFIDSIVALNFRCFTSLGVSFDKKLVVLVAPNGGGKTAILDGIAISLRSFVNIIEGKTSVKGFDKKDFRLFTSLNKMLYFSPLLFFIVGVFDGEEFFNQKGKMSKTTTKTKELKTGTTLRSIANKLAKQNQDYLSGKTEEVPTFPVISYYGTGRLWSVSRLTKGKKSQTKGINSRLTGYTDCLDPNSHYKFFVDWFRRYSYEALKEVKEGKESPHSPGMALKNIQRAVNTVLEPSGWNNPEWDFAEDCIIATHPEHGRLPVDFLSDGIRNMIGLVADIAHRAYRLNSHFKEMAAEKSPGIVLIDEVDMHLHPQWQQLVLNTLRKAFPEIQFIVTTHSPQVLTTIKKENIRILNIDSDGVCTAEMPEKSPLAQESGSVLADIMNVHPRPDIPDIIAKTHEYEQLILAGKGDSDEAAEIIKFLETEGYEFSDAVKAKFEFIKKRLTNKEK